MKIMVITIILTRLIVQFLAG